MTTIRQTINNVNSKCYIFHMSQKQIVKIGTICARLRKRQSVRTGARQNGRIAFRFPGKPESFTSISPFFLTQPQAKPASGGRGGAIRTEPRLPPPGEAVGGAD